MSTYDIPGASIYGQSVVAGKNAYQTALARINRQRSQALRSFGYQGDIDQEHGTLKNLRIDASNPYGQYQQMLRSHALSAQQAQTQAMDRGLSTSGGLGAQYERDLQYNFGDDSSRLGQTFADLLFQLQDQQNQAKYDYDQSLWQGQLEAARDAYEGGNFSYEGYGPEEYPQYGEWGPQPGLPTAAATPVRRPPTTVRRTPARVTPGSFRGTTPKKSTVTNRAQNPYAFRPKKGGGSR